MNLNAHRQQYKPLRKPAEASTVIAWICAVPVIAMLFGVLYLAERNDERARIEEAIEMRASTVLAKAEERKQRAARAICRQAHPHAEPRWTDTGELSCTLVAQANTRSTQP